MADTGWMTAAEAARALKVNRATLYAYVSRGFIRSEPRPGKSRERRYARDDVERLRTRDERRDAEKAERSLQWGVPVLESAVTVIANGCLYYRGLDATELARTETIEEVASLMWVGQRGTDFSDTQLHVVSGVGGAQSLPFIKRAQSVLAVVGGRDTLAYDLRAKAVAQTGWRILNLLTSVAAETAELGATVEETLVAKWAPRNRHAASLIRAALILTADHEMNVSSLTARCVASAGASPYSVVVAALSAIEGTRHGSVTRRVETLFDSLERVKKIEPALAERMQRGEPIEGFGHPLYRDGDPRAATLLEMIRDRYPKSAELAFARSLANAAESVLGEKPTIEFALTVLARVLHLEPGSPLTLFAIGRSIGWVAHAIEQYAIDTVIRPRSRYVGVMPG